MTLEELKRQKDGIEKEICSQLEEKDILAKKLSISSEQPPEKIDLKGFSQRIKVILRQIDPLKKQKIFQYFIRQILLDADTAIVNAVLPKELLVVPTSTLS